MHKFRIIPLLAILSACRTPDGATLREATTVGPPADVLNLIGSTYDPTVSAVETDDTSTVSLCRETLVKITAKDPVTLDAREVGLRLYVRKGTADAAKLKTVIVMPPTGGENVLDRNYARLLCIKGFRAALVEGWYGDTETSLDLAMHDRGALRMLAAVRHVIEYLKLEHAGQLGILGTSVGAISSVLVLGYEPRVAAAALIVGGGGLAEIIALSTEKGLTKLRAERLPGLGFVDTDAYRVALAAKVRIDPFDFIGYTGKKPVWMMVATKDTTVPTKNQWDLYHAYGDQELLTHDDDHINTIVYTAASKGLHITSFFAAQLK